MICALDPQVTSFSIHVSSLTTQRLAIGMPNVEEIKTDVINGFDEAIEVFVQADGETFLQTTWLPCNFYMVPDDPTGVRD